MSSFDHDLRCKFHYFISFSLYLINGFLNSFKRFLGVQGFFICLKLKTELIRSDVTKDLSFNDRFMTSVHK